MLHEDTTMNTFKHLVSEIDFVLEEPYVVLHVIGRFPHHIWGNRTCSDWPSWSSHILLACSRRSDSEERCEVKGTRKNKSEGGGEVLPSPPLLFIPFFTSHRSPLSERLEQANILFIEQDHSYLYLYSSYLFKNEVIYSMLINYCVWATFVNLKYRCR